MNYIGIDPGTKGAVGIIHSNGLISTYPWPGKYDSISPIRGHLRMAKAIKELGDIRIAMERVITIPRQGAKGIKTMGYNQGVWHTALFSEGIWHIAEIDPKAWQRRFFPKRFEKKKRVKKLTAKQKSLRKKMMKQESIDLAKKMFPSANIWDDGPAEALLIALHYKLSLEDSKQPVSQDDIFTQI